MIATRHRLLFGVVALLVIATTVVCTLPATRGPSSIGDDAPAQTTPRATETPVPAAGAVKAIDLVAEAQRGDLRAQSRLCADEMLTSEQTGSYRDSAYWCALAAEAGDARSQAAYARLYQLGAGVAQDDAQAAHWYEKAVAQQDAHAMYMRGRMLMASGDAADDVRGRAMLQRAASLGDANARWALQDLGEAPEKRRESALLR